MWRIVCRSEYIIAKGIICSFSVGKGGDFFGEEYVFDKLCSVKQKLLDSLERVDITIMSRSSVFDC